MKKGKKYIEAAKLVDRKKLYSIVDACDLAVKTSTAKFDATVEASFRLNLDPTKAEQNLRGAIVLPNGTGKSRKVLVITRGAKIQEALDALPDVIYHIETYDITTVRASTPMYLLARVIKSMGIKMVLSGEGSDELFGGYLYFHKAPNAKEFHEELVRKMSKLHLYDCLRANKSLMAWGVEGRVPFLDKDFIDIAMGLNPLDKMNIRLEDGKQRMEKWILRKAFEDLLPADICWRQKEQFSDGVGYNWIDTLKKMTEEKVSDAEFSRRENRFPVNPPKTKEEYYYREIFSRLFPSDSAARCVPHEAGVACSTAKALEWDAAWKTMDEPSGRAISGVH